MKLFTYRLLTTLALPLVAYSGWKRCKKHQAQQQKNPELAEIPHCFKSRFGFNPSEFQTGGIWVHAVSVGETRSIFPLLSELKKTYPKRPLTVTNGSTQGALQTLQFAPVPVQHQMLPYDYPFAVKRFLKQIQPKLVIMVETEIWPNLYQACLQKNIPIVLINARLKASSFKNYQKWGGKLIEDALNQTQFIGAQFAADAQRFQALGAHTDKIKTLGNLKFDLEIDAHLASKALQWRTDSHSSKRTIWVAASTHAHPKHPEAEQSEEQLLIEAHQQLLKQQPNALLILVPRHADRFDEVAQILENSGLKWQRRTDREPLDSGTQVYLADTVGELMFWYAIADTAFIGGSLVPFGGHNLLEPAALKKPVLSGPHFSNLQSLFQPFVDAQGVRIVHDSTQLANALLDNITHPEQACQLAENGYQCFQAQTGALERTMQALKPLLQEQSPQ